MTAQVLRLARDRISEKTLLVIDVSDIAKRYAKSMEHIGRIRDGSEGELANGYWTMEVIAVETGKAEVIPLYKRLYSIEAPDCSGENSEIIKAIKTVSRGVGHKGVWVMDRGGDRGAILGFLLGQQAEFIIRMKGDRHLVHCGQKIVGR